MWSLFKKKVPSTALAELVDNGREVAERAMRSPKFNDYKRAEPMFPMRVRVTDDAGSTWDATMEAGLTTTYLLLPGVRVKVRYDANRRDRVTIDDVGADILARNPQLKKD